MALNELDYLIIILLIFGAIRGYRTGLFLAIGSLLAVIGGIVIAKQYHHKFVLYLNSNYGVITNLSKYLEEKLNIMVWSSPNYSLHDLDNLSVYRDTIFNEINNLFGSFMVEINPALYIADIVVNIIVFLVIFLLTTLIIKSFFSIINYAIMRSPLAFVNRIIGTVIAVIKTTIIVIVCLSLIIPLIRSGAYLGFEGAIMSVQYINSSALVNSMKGIINIFQLMLTT